MQYEQVITLSNVLQILYSPILAIIRETLLVVPFNTKSDELCQFYFSGFEHLE